MNVLFLDIDGVLNTFSELDYYGINFICDKKVLILKNIVVATGAEIVLSSTWRIKKINRNMVIDALSKHGLKLLDCTPVLPHKLSEYIYRHKEISHWLERHPQVKKFAVIDDLNEAGVPGFRSSFFRTDEYVGLTDSMAVRIVNHLNGSKCVDVTPIYVDVPDDCKVHGFIYESENAKQLSEDMLDVVLPNGILITAGWYYEKFDEEHLGSYRVEVLRDYDRLNKFSSTNVNEIKLHVENMVRKFMG